MSRAARLGSFIAIAELECSSSGRANSYLETRISSRPGLEQYPVLQRERRSGPATMPLLTQSKYRYIRAKLPAPTWRSKAFQLVGVRADARRAATQAMPQMPAKPEPEGRMGVVRRSLRCRRATPPNRLLVSQQFFTASPYGTAIAKLSPKVDGNPYPAGLKSKKEFQQV